jgi:hypothetical protein
MMTRIPAAIFALAGLAALSACGAGESEFVTKGAAACVKDEGQQAAAKPQKKGSAQPTVVGAPPPPESLGSKTLIGQ